MRCAISPPQFPRIFSSLPRLSGCSQVVKCYWFAKVLEIYRTVWKGIPCLWDTLPTRTTLGLTASGPPQTRILDDFWTIFLISGKYLRWVNPFKRDFFLACTISQKFLIFQRKNVKLSRWKNQKYFPTEFPSFKNQGMRNFPLFCINISYMAAKWYLNMAFCLPFNGSRNIFDQIWNFLWKKSSFSQYESTA